MGQTCAKLVIVTLRLVIVPVNPLTLTVLGYALAFPAALIVIAPPLYVLTVGRLGAVELADKLVPVPAQTATSEPALTFVAAAVATTVVVPLAEQPLKVAVKV